jgi:quinol monooxygenase YgiN
VDGAGRVGRAVARRGPFHLIQDRQEPHRFISFGAWDEWSTADAWRSSEAFAERMRACRELCEDFRPNDSTLRAFIEG